VIGHDHAGTGRADLVKVVDGARAARSHTPAHHRTIRSVNPESARAGPRRHTSTAPAAVASTPAANVGTVRNMRSLAACSAMIKAIPIP
jgi:hypothetical protein